jgi:hypothetical protein
MVHFCFSQFKLNCFEAHRWQHLGDRRETGAHRCSLDIWGGYKELNIDNQGKVIYFVIIDLGFTSDRQMLSSAAAALGIRANRLCFNASSS